MNTKSQRSRAIDIALESQRIIDRFWGHVKVGTPEHCWEWRSYVGAEGYGRFSVIHDCPVEASRLAWAFHNKANPEDQFVLHTCDNKKCCNPHHLYLGDRSQNMRDFLSRNRHPHLERSAAEQDNGNSKLTRDDVVNIKAMIRSGISNTDIAAEYGVTHSAISLIRRGKTWSRVSVDITPNP